MEPPDPIEPAAPPNASAPIGGGAADWVDAHGDILFRYALVRVRDRGEAEDLVQETFLAAVRGLAGFDRRSSERTWLLAILRHKIADHFRGQRHDSLGGAEPFDEAAAAQFDASGIWRRPPGPWAPEPAELLETREFWRVLEACLAELPPRLARALTLRMLEEFDAAEVCEAMRVSAGNLWVMLHRARLRLRRCLELNWFDRGGGGSESP